MHLVRLSWMENGDSFDIALVTNRLLAGGVRGWWLTEPGADAEPGDFVLELAAAQRNAVAALGLRMTSCAGELPASAIPLASPRIALFSGSASRYPYDGYYALALLRLGHTFRVVDGAAIAQGALQDADLFVIPGGFATWGIDAAENSPGADAQVRAFLAHGGGALGSCGGAYYLSAGRPGWTGTANAKPLYTHEYLQSGVGVVEVALRPGPLAAGCPPTMDVPYYHGPIYGSLGEGINTVGTFAALSLPGSVAIDNPLDQDRFDRDLKGRPAILAAEGPRGRAVLFSPHPEMGDLLRKYIALDGYVRKYLPIRGLATLQDTMRHYRVCDAPSFRLLANAIAWLGARGPSESRRHERPSAPTAREASTQSIARLFHVLRERLDEISTAGTTDDERALLRFVRGELSDRVSRFEPRISSMLTSSNQELRSMIGYFVNAATEQLVLARAMPVAQILLDVELAISLLVCADRLIEIDAVIETAK